MVTTGDIYEDPLDPGFGAQDFPVGILTLLVSLSLILLVRSLAIYLRQKQPLIAAGELDDAFRYVVPTALIGFGYVWALELFQYALPTVVAATLILMLFGNVGRARLVVAPVVATLIYYVLFFGILGLHEAPGTILEYENQTYFRPMRDALGLF